MATTTQHKPGSVISRLKVLIADVAPAEFMPLKQDVESYLKSTSSYNTVVQQLLLKFPSAAIEGVDNDKLLEPRNRKPYVRRSKVESASLDTQQEVKESHGKAVGDLSNGDVTALLLDDLKGERSKVAYDDVANKEINGRSGIAYPGGNESPLNGSAERIGRPMMSIPMSNIEENVGISLDYNSSCVILDQYMGQDIQENDPQKRKTYKKKGYNQQRKESINTEKSENNDKEATDMGKAKNQDTTKASKRLLWPLVCWICREPMNRRTPYVICNSTCRRAFHVNCEGSKASKLKFSLKPAGADELTVDSDVSSDPQPVTNGAPTTNVSSDSSEINDNVKYEKDTVSVMQDVKAGNSTKRVRLQDPGALNNHSDGKVKRESTGEGKASNDAKKGTSNIGYTRLTPNCISRECFFCLNSYRGCSNCHRFFPLKRLSGCAVKGCTTFYCYPKCISSVRVVVPDKRVIDLHKIIYGNIQRLLDERKRPIFICHGHTCWSCYDCDRYSYIWEAVWRVEAHRYSHDYMSTAWQNLRITCRGKVETSHFAKNKKIPRPPRYPDMKSYKSYMQAKRLNLYGILNAASVDHLYPLSDDEERATFHKFVTNVLLRCIRCERTWCTSCLHPDVHILPHSAKQMICQDCIHIEIAQCLALESTGPDNNLNMAQREVLDPHLEIESTDPMEIYEQISKYIDEQKALRGSLAMGPSFLDEELFIQESDLPSELPEKRTYQPRAYKAMKKRVLKGEKRNFMDPTKILMRHQEISTIARRRLDNMRCREFSAMVKECDELTIIRLSNDFKYQSANVITDESLRTIAGPTGTQRCTCKVKCGQSCINASRNIECNSVNCIMNEANCGNRRFRNMASPRLILKPIEGKGIGAFATETIESNELVCEYVGEMITQAEFQRCINSWSFAELDNENHSHWYIMKVHKDAYIDSTNQGNVARFINHSCDPNCSSIPFNVNGSIRMGVFALRKIMKGEEVTYNYGFSSRGVGAGFKCYCGSQNCRGVVGIQPDNAAEAIEKIQSLREAGCETDTLLQLTSDLASVYISKDSNRMKQRPSPVDIFNGMFTAGDLYRYEQMLSKKKLNTLSRISQDVNLPYHPMVQILEDNLHVNHALFNFVKLLALGGQPVKEWDMANTKIFGASMPWAIIALGNNKISNARALECSGSFPDFYEKGKRFIQIACMVSSTKLYGKQASENLQEILDLTWGSTEACFVCGGYGDCKYCEYCGDVLHDDGACGEFYIDKDGFNLCSVCQNSDHRYQWLTASDIEREVMAMDLWSLRMERSYKHCVETFREILSECTQTLDSTCGTESPSAEDGSSKIFVRPETLFCTRKEYDRFCKSPLAFHEKQLSYHSMCQNALNKYNCFW